MAKVRLKAERAPGQHWLVTAGLCLAVLACPVVWTESVVAAFTLPKLLILALAVLFCALGKVLGWRQGFVRTPLDLSLAGCAAAMGLSLFFSQDRLLSFFGMYNHYAFGVWPLSLCAFLYFSAAGEDSEPRRRFLLGCALSTAAAVGAYGALQAAGFDPFLRVELPGGRAMATMGSPVHLGAYLALISPLALWWAMEKEGYRPLRALLWVAIMAGLISSGSRGAMAGAGLGCVLYLGLSGRFEALRSRRARWAAGIIVALVLAVAGLRMAIRPSMRGGESPRLDIWRTAWASFLEHPILGSGPDTFEQSFRRLKPASYIRLRTTVEYQANAHNDILQVLATMGLAGAAAYCWLLAALVGLSARALKDGSRADLAAALSAGLAGYFLNMKFSPMPLEGFALAAVFAGLLCPAPEPAAGKLRPWMAAGAAALALASLVLAIRMVAADREMKTSARMLASGRPEFALPRMLAGVRLDPCELSYRISLVNHLTQRAVASPADGVRRDLLALAEKSGIEAVACHPSDMRSHYIYGVASLMQARIGRTDRLAVAEYELDAALRLEPSLMNLLVSRLETAQLRGDRAAISALQARIKSLEN